MLSFENVRSSCVAHLFMREARIELSEIVNAATLGI